jgi:tetratricopeptide (TPR) repeat protein
MLALLTAVIGGAATYATAEVRKDHLGKAMQDIADWDFEAAERRMRLVVGEDPQRAPERVLLAQLLMLKGEPSEAWKPLVVQAMTAPNRLDSSARLRSRALLAFANQDYEAACEAFAKLGDLVPRRNTSDATPALAHADCLREDRAIVPDDSSPTGYRFRASLAFVDSVYGAILDQFSTEPRVFSSVAPRMQQLLSLDPRQLRTGRMPTGTRSRWYSLPILAGDTLSYIPYPLPPSGEVAEFGKVEAVATAIERNRRRLRAVAMAWTARAPEDPRSHEMLAAILEAGGELDGTVPSALAEIRTARGRLTGDIGSSDEVYLRRLRLGDDQVRILLRMGQYGAAARLADSILAIQPPPELNEATKRHSVDVRWRLSALRGKVENVIDLEVPYAADVRALTDEGLEELPPLIAIDVIALNNYSVFGGPTDSITHIARRISDRVGGLVSPTKSGQVRKAILRRPYMLAAPVIGTSRIASLPPSGDPIMLAMVAHSRHDLSSTRRYLDSLDAMHRDLPPGEISIDVTYLKAWLTAAIGENARAAEILDNAFAGVSKASRSALGSPELIGSFVRAMILRSQLATRTRDAETARLWRSAATDLWGETTVSTYLKHTPLTE